MIRHLEALYETDARGRVRCARAPSTCGAPRLHLARTCAGNVWRLRADLGADLVRRLATLSAKEAPLAGLRAPAPPEREPFLRRALESAAPIAASWSGPVFVAVASLRSVPGAAAAVRELGPADAERLDPALGLERRDLARGGCFGALAADRVVSVCRCARGDGSGPTEATVVTAPAHRGRGHGLAVVRAWCEGVRARGGEAFFRAAWPDVAARALAARLGLEPIGEDRCWD
jgi:hypothetical protein